MQARFPIERDPSTKRVAIGYISRPFREWVNGDDTFRTILKSMLLGGLGLGLIGGAISAYALFILITGGIGALIYAGLAIKDEYDRNKKEKAKIAKLEAIERENEEIAKSLDNVLNPRRNANYVNVSGLENGQLLKIVLRSYLEQLGLFDCSKKEFNEILERKRKRNGTLPDQEGMISLLESVTGFSRKTPQFANAVKRYLQLRSIPNFRSCPDAFSFDERVVLALGLNGNKDGKRKNNAEEAIDLYPDEPKKKGVFKVLSFIKNALFFVAKSNTAYALVIGSGILYGLIVAGVTMSWPLFAGGLVVALLTGTAVMVYKKYVEKNYKTNNENVDKHLAYQETRYNLLYKYNRLRTKQYYDYPEYHSEYGEGLENGDNLRLSLAEKNVIADNPQPFRMLGVRHAASVIAQAAYGAIVGLIIGMGITSSILLVVSMASIALTPLAPLSITIVGVIGASLLSARYGYWLGKRAHKACEAEKLKMEKVAALQEKSEKRWGEQKVRIQLNKSKSELIQELMAEYVAYSNVGGGQRSLNGREKKDLQLQEVLSKREKIIRLIERASGVTRNYDPNTQLPVNDDQFFNKLSLYLQSKSPAIGVDHVNGKVTQFKAAVLGKPINECIVNQVKSTFPTKQEVKEKLAEFKDKVLVKHILSLVAAVSIASPAGFALFGPAAPLAAVAILLIGTLLIYGVHKFCEYHATQNAERMAKIEAKLPLIEAIEKTIKSRKKLEPVQGKGPAPRKVVILKDPAPKVSQEYSHGRKSIPLHPAKHSFGLGSHNDGNRHLDCPVVEPRNSFSNNS